MKRVVISDVELVLPDVEPPDRGLGRRVTGDERLLIPVIGVVRARREAEVRRRKLVPEAARGLVALVLRLEYGRLVPVVVRVSAEIRGVVGRREGWIVGYHGPEVLGEGRGGRVGQGSAPDRPTTARVPLLAEVLHLLHVGPRDAVVARLPEENARIVPEVDHAGAHDVRALRPLPAGRVPLLVAGRGDVDDPEIVIGDDVRALRGDVHPADVVAVALTDEVRVVVVHPVGHSLTEGSPVIRGALREAEQIDEAIVDVQASGAHAPLECGLADPRPRRARIEDRPPRRNICDDVVEVRRDVAPQLRGGERAVGGEYSGLTGGERRVSTLEGRDGGPGPGGGDARPP